MKTKEIIRKAHKFVDSFRVTDGKKFRLKDFDPATRWASSPKPSRAPRRRSPSACRRWPDLQDKLYAQDKWGVLLIFQAMDAAGKDGAIKHVMSGVNPQGCDVHSFKSPSAEDLDHDYLWRCMKVLPEPRPHRHLQPQLLRGNARRARASGISGEAKTAAGTGHQGHLAASFRGHPQF